MTSDDIKRLCAEVQLFARKNDLRFSAEPVLTWEFGDVSEFALARRELLKALTADLAPTRPERLITPGMVEVDCYGITFRLVCKKTYRTSRGPVGAAEVELYKPPDRNI